ncbi:MAG: transcriptional regulator [Halobacteriota archaeon]
MADLNPIAKRIYNVSPKPVRITLDDGTSEVYHLSSAEFFQREFQAEGTCDADDATYRLTTTEDTEAVIMGRQRAGDSGWSLVGTVVDAESIE